MKAPYFTALAVAALFLSSHSLVKAEPNMRVEDFKTVEALGWITINDTVMGGRSNSSVSVKDGKLHFTGYLNTNGGGFTSSRTAPQSWKLEKMTRVRVRVMGDGRTYQIRLHPDRRGIAYKYPFKTEAGLWQTIDAPIHAFQATRRGTELDLPPPRPQDVASVGFLLADRTDGAFELVVDWIEFAP